MNRLTTRIRQPVQRENAEGYLLVTLLSFAASVIFTRLFLALTGYPQLGGGGFHIAHVLWGGVILFIATLVPLVFANRWVYFLSAILSGVGVGLFIDEVGKFITANNNYFHPLAAPIIYAFFLMIVLLYLRLQKFPSKDARTEIYYALDAMEEVLDHDLDPQERARLEESLKSVMDHSDQPDMASLASSLLQFLNSDETRPVFTPYGPWDIWQTRWQKFERRWITSFRLKAALTGGLVALGVLAISTPLLSSLPTVWSQAYLRNLLVHMILTGQVSSTSLNWYAARLALEVSVGLLLILAALLLNTRKQQLAIAFGYLGLILSLTTVNLLIFYFDQFSTILTATAQFIVLLGLIYYRRHFTAPDDSRNRA